MGTGVLTVLLAHLVMGSQIFALQADAQSLCPVDLLLGTGGTCHLPSQVTLQVWQQAMLFVRYSSTLLLCTLARRICVSTLGRARWANRRFVTSTRRAMFSAQAVN